MKLKNTFKTLAIAIGLLTSFLGFTTSLLAQAQINVYPDVPGLADSEYYSFSLQEVSKLDSTEFDQVSNWLTPFAWFTKCIDHVEGLDTAYFDEFMGSWTHTYCNFEMAQDTPIVVKISRLDKPGAPSGDIISAVARPARSVESLEIIDGDVYVTMKDPALVVIDIDGRMESRRAPLNALNTDFYGDHSPFNNEMDATHAVTIFANPFLENKPDPSDPLVKCVEPGDPMPEDDGTWETLYFMPGIHKMSVDESGNERLWKTEDVYDINSNRNYYIPGDAIVYGNFNDMDGWQEDTENVRLFGHGTLSGTKIPHWRDWPRLYSVEDRPSDADQALLRVCEIAGAKNCIVEGITVADQAEHGIYLYANSEEFSPNRIKWTKMISWRVNADGMHASGNGYIEDCFIRHQDDAIYLDGMAIRRVILWSDCNGAPLRGSRLLESRRGNFPSSLPQTLTIEDIDIVYARSYYGGAVFSPAGPHQARHYADGTLNTGQHVVFRNITVSDPLPQRILFGANMVESTNTTFSGLTFENVHFDGSHFLGNPIELLGSDTARIDNWYLENVTIAGETIDQAYLNDPTKTRSNEYLSNFHFPGVDPPRDPDLDILKTAVSFDSESHPGDEQNISIQGSNIGNIQQGNWIAFDDFEFGTAASYATLTASSALGDQALNGTVEFRLDSEFGTMIGSVAIGDTGSLDNFRTFSTSINRNARGTHKLYLVFTGNLAIQSFQINSGAIPEPQISINAVDFDAEIDEQNGDNIRIIGDKVGFIQSNNWIAFNDVDFGNGVSFCTVMASSQFEDMRPYETIDFRLGSENGELIGTVKIGDTMDYNNFRQFIAPIDESITGVQTLYLVFSGGIDIRSFQMHSIDPPTTGFQPTEMYFEDNDVVIQLDISGGRTYRVESSTDLISWTVLPGQTGLTSGTTRVNNAIGQAGETRRFFRIEEE